VRLTVRDRGGLTNFVIKKVPVGIVPPKADFSFSPASPEVGDEVQFTDKSTDDGQIVSRQWDFGDGTKSTEQNPKKKYTQPGTFKVKLTVRDNDGAESTVEKTITVKPSGRPVVGVFPNPARESATFTFTLPAGATSGTLVRLQYFGEARAQAGEAHRDAVRVGYQESRRAQRPVLLSAHRVQGERCGGPLARGEARHSALGGSRCAARSS
jgi:plastocyanin